MKLAMPRSVFILPRNGLADFDSNIATAKLTKRIRPHSDTSGVRFFINPDL